jgi:hypothetical protein
MKKLLLIPLLFSMAACSTTRAPATKLNCKKLEADSDAKLLELQKIFAAYQEVNYDLAVKLAPALREEADSLNERVKKQKQRCWPGEKRPVDQEIVVLKDELTKVYGLIAEVPKKVRAPASVHALAPPPMPEAKKAPSAEAPELIMDTPAPSAPAPATPAAVEGDSYE